MFRRFTQRRKEAAVTNSENDAQQGDRKEPSSESTMNMDEKQLGTCDNANDKQARLAPSISVSASPSSTLSSNSDVTVNRKKKNKPALEITVKKWDMSRADRLSPKTPNSCLPGTKGEQERSQDFQESIQKISMEASVALDRLNELEHEVKYYRAMTGLQNPFEKQPLHLTASSPKAAFHRNHRSGPSSGSGMMGFLTSLPVKYSTSPTISRSTSAASGWSSTDDSGSTFSSMQSEITSSPSYSHCDFRSSIVTCTPPSNGPSNNGSCVAADNNNSVLVEELRDLRKKFSLYRHQLTQEKSLRRKAEEELEECKQELEGLTQELFQQANEKVATERRIRFSVEEQLKEALIREEMHRRRLHQLQTALKSISTGRRLLDSSPSDVSSPTTPDNHPLSLRKQQAVDLT